jgi:hypothetical protein
MPLAALNVLNAFTHPVVRDGTHVIEYQVHGERRQLVVEKWGGFAYRVQRTNGWTMWRSGLGSEFGLADLDAGCTIKVLTA